MRLIAQRIRRSIADATAIAGLASITYGLQLFYLPLAWLFVGVVLTVGGVYAAIGERTPRS